MSMPSSDEDGLPEQEGQHHVLLEELIELITKHQLIVLGAADAFLKDAIALRKVYVVLAMLMTEEDFPSVENHNILSIESLLLFYGLLETTDGGWKGSSPGKLPNIERHRDAAHQQLLQDYFSGDLSTYPEAKFRRRFRMGRELFQRIVSTLEMNEPYFQQHPDATGKMGASAIQKVTAAVRLLAYGGPADQLDDWIRLGESTILDCLKQFVAAVLRNFGDTYLRAPTMTDILLLLQQNAKRGFPGCLGSIDCWHWEWKNCPSGWAAHYKGKKGKGCVAEMCCGPDLWIWHLFCGNPGSLNDLNVLHRSPLLRQIYTQTMPKVDFQVNGTTYSCPYWLADGIYPELSVFVTGFAVPNTAIDKNFTHWQESIRKDIERAFGVLQARWCILSRPARQWHRHYLDDILECCVVLHNMIVEDERDLRIDMAQFEVQYDDFDGNVVRSADNSITVKASPDKPGPFALILQKMAQVHDSHRHRQLREDLKQHLFANFPHYQKKTYR